MTGKAAGVAICHKPTGPEQVNVLYGNGVYAGERKAVCQTILLVRLRRFYVAADCQHSRTVIAGNAGILQPYFGQMSIRNPVQKKSGS